MEALALRRMARFTGTGGLVECSTSTMPSGLMSSLEFLDRTGAYATNFDTYVQKFDTRRVTIIALV